MYRFRLAAPMSRFDTIELVCLMEGSAYLELDDTSNTRCDFLPVLDAIDPKAICSLGLRDYSASIWDDEPSLHPLNPTLARFTELGDLTIAIKDVHWNSLAVTLSPLICLETIVFETPAVPTALCVRSLISGPTKLPKLVKVELNHIEAERGPFRRPKWSEGGGHWVPADDWNFGRSVLNFLNDCVKLTEHLCVLVGPANSR